MKSILTFLFVLIISGVFFNCRSQNISEKPNIEVNTVAVYPFSDPNNTGNWRLNTNVSDEFDDEAIDEDKWYIVGKFKKGKPFYKDPENPGRKVWKGRATG